MRALRFLASLPLAALAWLLFADVLIGERVHGATVDLTRAVRGRRP